MPRLSKQKLEQRRLDERKLVKTLIDKLNAASDYQTKDQQPRSKDDHKIINEYTQKLPKHTSRKSCEMLKKEIHFLLTASNLTYQEIPKNLHLPSREEKAMIRTDWYGSYRQPEDSEFSTAYIHAKQEYYQKQFYDNDAPVFQQYSPQQYKLESSISWQDMSNFPNFASCAGKIRYQLAKMQISPSTVASMNFFDFSEVLHLWAKEHDKPLFEGTKSQNIKLFEHCYGDNFEEIMTYLHYNPEFIAETRDDMRNGRCSPLLNFHHKTPVFMWNELPNRFEVNAFPNTLLTFVSPHHRAMHFNGLYRTTNDLAFFGGFDPLFQIKRKPEKEQQYLLSQTRGGKNAKNTR
ncbi:MAG: hypothetical protein E7018_03640 [Alphaproteobacteria bacterium]|nr:hypothetical protein [Alphaproteobacteria bacterium]